MAGDGWDLDPDALARAEAAVDALTGDYLGWVSKDVVALAQAVAALASAPPEQWRHCAAAVFDIAHDIKGQGTTFGYPLVSCLAQAACDLVRDATAPEPGLSGRLEELAAAMAEVVAARLSGDGGRAGRDLLTKLKVNAPGLTPEG